MQTSVSLAPNKLPSLGHKAEQSKLENFVSRMTSGPVKAGKGVFRMPGFGGPGSSYGDPGQVYQNPTPAAAASTTAILASGGATSASTQLIDTEANGTYAATDMVPARLLTLVLSSHADWNATTGVFTYYNQDGELVTENVSIPDAGNATVTTTGYCKTFVSLSIPAQGGTGGTFTIGVAALDSSVTLADFEGVAFASPCAPPYSSDYDFGDEVSIAVAKAGVICCETEGTPAYGDDVYVGTAASNFGKFRNDNTNAVAVTGAKFGYCENANNKAAIRFLDI